MNTVDRVGEVVSINAAREVLESTRKAGKGKRRAAVKLVPQLRASERRSIGQFIAAIAAAFLPLASYVIAHHEVKDNPQMWVLVAFALVFSAPTLAEWAEKWTRSRSKSWGFTVLLEGVMVASSTTYLAYAGLVILVAINAHSAWALAGKRLAPKAQKQRHA